MERKKCGGEHPCNYLAMLSFTPEEDSETPSDDGAEGDPDAPEFFVIFALRIRVTSFCANSTITI